jgi:hypothetical protein
VIYVYAITEASSAGTSVRGIDARPVSFITCGELVAACSEHERKPEASEEALVEHESVVEALMRSGTVIPMRFGQVEEEISQLRDRVDRCSTTITAALERLRGRVEIGVRAFALQSPPRSEPAATTPTGASGHTYMTSRLRQERIARKLQEDGQEIAEELHGKLDGLAETSTLKARQGRMVMAGAYLVPKAMVDDFIALVQQLTRDYLGKLELVSTGPWPPYSFVDVHFDARG